jgi:hypothetical protein
LAGRKVGIRDALYNAFTPLVPTLIIMIVGAVQCVPLMIVAICYSAAIETGLFNNVLYGILLVLFMILMVALSVFLLSGTLMSLVAVTVPGTYPMEALRAVHEVLKGKRIKMILKVLLMLVMIVVIVVIFVVPLMPITMATGVNLITGGAFVASCFATEFMGLYLYLNYRELIGYKEKKHGKK